jgi:hypothetical protein
MISTKQKTMLRAMLAQANLSEAKDDLVYSFTAERTKHSSDMELHEYTQLINYIKAKMLPRKNPDVAIANKLRRKIIALAWQMNWTRTVTTNGFTSTHCDVARIDAWCMKYGYKHQALNRYTTAELPKLITQFTKVYNDYLKAI